MIAAIYARKSPMSAAVSEDAKSVTRQVEHARAYAVARGWQISEDHVYADDDASGAEFSRRPGYMRLLSVLGRRAPFDVLIVSELSRLGREQLETGYAVKQLSQAGVKIHAYLEGKEVLLDSPVDKFLMTAVAFAAEIEREKGRERTKDALLRKARAGFVAGGSCFGYRNIEVRGPDGHRSHVTREIDPDQADVIRWIFQLCAEGHGTKAIAKTLNNAGAPSPRAQQGRSQSWSPTSVREILFRPLYRGLIVWNASAKRDRWGQRRQQARPEHEWLRVDAPELRIVSDEIWTAAHARLDAARATYLKGTNGNPFGRPKLGDPSKYLLTGLARCGWCGNGMIVASRNHGRTRAFTYRCAGYHQRGPAVCRNARALPMEDGKLVVIESLLDDVITPDLVNDAVDEALGLLTTDTISPRLALIEQEVAKVEAERDRLVAAITAGGTDLPGLLAALRTRESRLTSLRSEQQAIAAQRRAQGQDAAKIRQELVTLAGEWRRVLANDPANARPIVSTLLADRVTFTPLEDAHHWELRGQGTLIGLFGGPVVSRGLVSPTGFEPVFQP